MKYSLGLDIGTTSVGWAVVNEDKKRIEDCGVRIFERPENPKNGESLAAPRRTARSARRRLNRRRQRLDFLKSFFVEKNLLTGTQIADILAPDKDPKIDPYATREKALLEKLSNEELFATLYHIAKRRGYKSNRKKIEEEDKKGEDSKVLGAISKNKALLASYDTKSIATVLNRDDQFKAHRRNKADDYNNSFIREDFLAEIEEIINAQRQLGFKISAEDATDLLWRPNRGLFYQRPFMTPELINKMRGNCPFEKPEPRAPKASYTFELFRLAENLSHLKYNNGNRLTPEQIQACIGKCKTTAKVTYKAIQESIGHKNDPNFIFDYIRGPQQKFIKDGDKKSPDPAFDPLSNTFAEMKFYHAVKKTLKDLPVDWGTVEADPDLFDQIGYIFTTNKDDASITKELTGLNVLSVPAIKNLLALNFSGFGHLSLKALKNLTPHLLAGETYDKAVELAYPGQFLGKLSGDLSKLPPLDENEQNQVTNPVVKRAISQVNKVVNAIIAKYGAPTQIKIETANELAKNFKERGKIKKDQDENAAINEKLKQRLINEFKVATPTGLQITKFKLYNDQNGICLYCGEKINLHMLFSDEHYCEIDHITPYSRCGNDSKTNLVLVHNSHNQEKKNQTPFEAWGNDEKRWQAFIELVCGIYSNEKHPKRTRLLSEQQPDEKWNERALNDTRYINKFLSQRFRKYLNFASDREIGAQKVLTPNGRVTASLRRVYGINKSREENNLHHAADACVLATVSQGTIHQFAEWNKWRELHPAQHIQRPEPWADFGKEVRLRASELKPGDTLATYREQFRDLYKSQDEEFKTKVSPIFVSRMPKRNGTGATNKETIRSPKLKDGDQRTIRKRLSDVKLVDLEKSVLPESDKALYKQLKTLLETNNNDPKKAFANPVYKNNKTHDKNGRPLMSVSTIKVYTTDPDRSGFYINHGKGFVNNGSMVRLDVYRRVSAKKKIEHFFVPIYTYQIKAGKHKKHSEAIESTKILPIPRIDGKLTTNVDESFSKVCSLYPNDYVKFVFADEKGRVLKAQEGYYSTYDSSRGTISVIAHTSASKDKNALLRISPRQATKITRLDISVLGDNYTWG